MVTVTVGLGSNNLRHAPFEEVGWVEGGVGGYLIQKYGVREGS